MFITYKVITLNFLMVVFSSNLVLAQMGLANCVCVDDLKRYLILLAYQFATYFHLTKIEFFFKQTLFTYQI